MDDEMRGAVESAVRGALEWVVMEHRAPKGVCACGLLVNGFDGIWLHTHVAAEQVKVLRELGFMDKMFGLIDDEKRQK